MEKLSKEELNAIATRMLQDLIMCRMLDFPEQGKTAKEISLLTRIDIFSAFSMLNKLIDCGLIEENKYRDDIYYRAINIPEYFHVSVHPNIILDYATRKTEHIKFSGTSKRLYKKHYLSN
ncbi:MULTISPECIES: hypothetical protein [Vibrio]|uniref:hypothetical protein n=1 Tax=Vibrio TaxID=662 RepID=UPI0022CD3D87|nr:hypothetical protein [Vibrio sp. MM46]ELY1987659.1 hypothetical protein [Vibrio harveyi]MDA0122507.1 hypothetical protein [Vibrio sp. MM46]